MHRTERGELPELWGGVECTINRVGDRYHDQLRRSRHLERPEDVERFAALGLRALRVPIVWEHACEGDRPPAFHRVEPMLDRVKACGLRAIAGLVHHGSGPSCTQLLDPAFEHRLADYAGTVARHFPWISDFTPVNEPLTTARFSALYGHWYPHAAGTAPFLRALVHQCRAVVRAMHAIREINPHARLVQTEDLACVRSSPGLAYQAEYENQRRFLSLDLLCGRVDASHPLYEHLRSHGIQERELAFFVERPCAPDILGVNYYFTSDRYLDEHWQRYPSWCHGGNGRARYADIDAAHVAGVGLAGHAELLRTVWQRYQLPLAITEVHAGCTREEQLRWFHEAWQAARKVRSEGVDLRAVTAWALLGSFDWNSLVCRDAGVYEPGVFDVRSEVPRPTAIARMVESLAKTGSFDHPVLSSPGWWRRISASAAAASGSARPIVITGARGSLARAFARACEARALPYELLTRQQLDITQPEAVRSTLQRLRPWAVINAAGFMRIDEAEEKPHACQRANADGPALLAETCDRNKLRLLTFSSDLVFDGKRREPYLESHHVAPLSVYGASQADAERRVLGSCPDALIARTSCLFGTWQAPDALTSVLTELARGRSVRAPLCAMVSPTYVPHLVDACLDLLMDGASQLWHLTNVGCESWSGLARRIATAAKLPGNLVYDDPAHPVPKALRPSYSVLASERGTLMPTLEEALERCVKDIPITAGFVAA
jgi:dTDP-4-dehydrorhamnose reductase